MGLNSLESKGTTLASEVGKCMIARGAIIHTEFSLVSHRYRNLQSAIIWLIGY